eukprot:197532-Pyramimonas_sp.AAC.1
MSSPQSQWSGGGRKGCGRSRNPPLCASARGTGSGRTSTDSSRRARQCLRPAASQVPAGTTRRRPQLEWRSPRRRRQSATPHLRVPL